MIRSLQPYNSSNDTDDIYINNESLSKFVEYYRNTYNFENFLEVGCGNGRLSKMLDNFTSKPSVMLDAEIVVDDTNFKNTTFKKIDFAEYSDSLKYDLIILVGTFFVLCEPSYKYNLTKLLNLLSESGNLVIIENFTRFKEDGFDLDRFQSVYRGRKLPWKQTDKGFFNLEELLQNTSYHIKETYDLNQKYRGKVITHD